MGAKTFGMFSAPIPLRDLIAVDDAARRLAPLLRSGDLIALQGPLGAGKTTFARALLRAFGIDEDVPSPTFTLLQTYDAPHFTIYHFDLDRLENETELEELGWDDALADGLVHRRMAGTRGTKPAATTGSFCISR